MAQYNIVKTWADEEGLDYDDLNAEFSAVQTALNNIEDEQLQADTLTERVFSDDINPRLRNRELLGYEFIYSGYTPSDDGGVTVGLAAGTAYVYGYRVTTGGTTHDYSSAGTYYIEVGTDGVIDWEQTSETPQSNHIQIAKVISTGADLTSVTDLRKTTLFEQNYLDYLFGYRIFFDTTGQIRIGLGEAVIQDAAGGGGLPRRRRDTSSQTAGATNNDGTFSSFGNDTWYYVYLDGDVSKTGADVIISTNSTAPQDGSSYYRKIGAFKTDGSGNIDENLIVNYESDNPTVLFAKATADQSVVATSYTDVTDLTVTFTPTRYARYKVKVYLQITTSTTNDFDVTIDIDGTDEHSTTALMRWERLGNTGGIIFFEWITGPLDNSEHTIKIQAMVDGGTTIIESADTNAYMFVEEV